MKTNFVKINKIQVKVESILILFIIISSLLNVSWILLDNYPPRGSTDFIDAMIANELPFIEAIKELYIHTTITEPPLMEVFMLTYYKLFGMRTKNELIINTFFLIVLLISTYKIGEHIYNKKVGLFSVLLLNSFYLVIAYTKQATRMFPLLSLLSLSFWMLLKSDYFQNRKYSLFIGIGLGLTALVKYTFVIFIFPFFIYILYSLKFIYPDIKKKKLKKKSKNILLNLLLALFLFTIITSSWYFFHFSRVYQRTQYRLFENPDELGKINLDFWEQITYYLHSMFNITIGFLITLLFLFGCIYKLFTKPKFEEKLMIITFIVPYFFLSFISLKTFDQLLPVYFVIPIITTEFIFKFKKIKVPILTILLLFLVLNMAAPFSYRINTPNLGYENHSFKIIKQSVFREFLSFSEEKSVEEKVINRINATDSKILLMSPVHIWEFAYLNHMYEKNLNIYATTLKKQGYFYNMTYGDNVNKNFDSISLIKNKEVNYIVIFLPKDYQDFQTYKYSYLALAEVNNSSDYFKIGNFYGSNFEKVYIELYRLS